MSCFCIVLIARGLYWAVTIALLIKELLRNIGRSYNDTVRAHHKLTGQHNRTSCSINTFNQFLKDEQFCWEDNLSVPTFSLSLRRPGTVSVLGSMALTGSPYLQWLNWTRRRATKINHKYLICELMLRKHCSCQSCILGRLDVIKVRKNKRKLQTNDFKQLRMQSVVN